ncbi:MAG: golvesin C-terminal-like domain-containing protein [Bacteroidota bacterium]
MKNIFRHTILLSLIVMTDILSAQGSVYLVLGSDTGIWDGLNPGNYINTYGLDLYDNPAFNGYKVMDPAFRSQFKDSYGTPMKMTWWMMAGNMYRFATNTNIPVPNIMTLYLMKKYHGEQVKILGDELSLHYHTFAWTDYNQDGTSFWNQAQSFTECREDFDLTMAQFLIEENIFPVSFRSGWHYMDNAWQNLLDGLVPYSMHNDYPSKRMSTTEPIDNVYDWSRASKEYVPYQPSLADYQVPGDGKSWNVRSRFMGSIRQSDMDSIFAKASRGIDQVPCFWAHLPEVDFPENMKKIDSLAHASAAKYPTVKFSYCTAVEAMQQWRKGNDATPPLLTMTEVPAGDQVRFAISTDEPIFQTAPFVAIKDIDNRYTILHCTSSGANQWITDSAVTRSQLVKAGVAVTDTMGNLSTAFITILPDDIYIDNLEPGYHETAGMWTSSTVRAWGTNSRQSVLGANDSAVAEWIPSISETRMYSIFMQIPSVAPGPESLLFRILTDGVPVDSAVVAGPFAGKEWIYIVTTTLTEKSNNTIQMIARGNTAGTATVAADVIRLTAVIKNREIYTRETALRPAAISEDDTTILSLKLENRGVNNLTISNMYSVNSTVGIDIALPVIIPGMSYVDLPLVLYSETTGTLNDTIVFLSDDARSPVYTVSVQMTVEPYFRIVDNEDSLFYSETGPWLKSVAQRWGSSSRFAYSGSGATATFTAAVKKEGIYEIFEIVPTTVNAVKNALYVIHSGTDTLGTLVVDQNEGSGVWISLGTYALKNTIPASVTVIDQGPASSLVLRADAVKFQIVTPTSVSGSKPVIASTFVLDQNYPNPFNPVTTIGFSVPDAVARFPVTVRIYDLLGRCTATLINESMSPGHYTVRFDGTPLASGVYYYQLQSGNFRETRKMILAK